MAVPPEPIAAIATAPGRGAIGIVRMSGPGLDDVMRDVCGRVLQVRVPTYSPFMDPRGEAIDHGLAIYFAGPHSATGEDVLELHAHGGMVVLQLLLARCVEAGKGSGMRMARPGEFTQRAFLNDKMDLAQAEAVADLIDASTETAARCAARSLSGAFSAEIHRLLSALTELRVLVEATLDFPEEEVDILRRADVEGRLRGLHTTLNQIRQRARQGALLREGIKVVIAGQPNAGKSSLLNALAGAELAIVSPIAGTTRDKVQQAIQIEGVPVHVIDTAGLRDSTDAIEKMGVARAWAELELADAVLFVHDLTALDTHRLRAGMALERSHFTEGDKAIASALATRLAPGTPVIDVWNKRDAIDLPLTTEGDLAVSLSAKTGEGLDRLRRALLGVVGWQSVPEGIYMARERHLQALVEVESHLGRAVDHLEDQNPQLDLLAEDLRLAQNALGEITGAFGADDLLGEIFATFCMGK